MHALDYAQGTPARHVQVSQIARRKSGRARLHTRHDGERSAHLRSRDVHRARPPNLTS